MRCCRTRPSSTRVCYNGQLNKKKKELQGSAAQTWARPCQAYPSRTLDQMTSVRLDKKKKKLFIHARICLEQLTSLSLSLHIICDMSRPLQEFRAESSSEIVAIPTFVDQTTKQNIVRWKDIQQRFENVKYVLNGTTSVLLLTDDWLQE